MNDLSQKTGVSVESLSKFQQAANASGTSIEGVGAAMIKLNKGLAAGTGPAADALKALGLSATDASGKLKTTDAVMLEVADKFKAMPDGAGKTALALQLFGKAGADMIPLLNGGSKAITDLSATMTTGFAQAADSLNDKLAALQGKLLELGVNIGTALMPALNVIADLVLGLANAFAAMPEPLQNIIIGIGGLTIALVLLAPAIGAVVKAFGLLSGLKIGATIAGWAPAIIPLKAALAGFITWVGSTLIPGLIAFFSGPVGWTVLAVAAVVAMVVLFRKPIGDFFNWLGGAISTAFSGLMKLLYPIFVQPFIDLWNNVLRGPITTLFSWIGGYIKASMQTAYALAYAVFVLPWILLWDKVLREPITAALAWISNEFQFAMKVLGTLAYQVFVQPWVNLWNNVLREPVTAGIKWIQDTWKGITTFFNTNVVTPIRNAWTTLTEFLPKAMNAIGDKVKSIFTGVVNTVKGAMRNVLQFIANAVNSVGANVNKLIGAFNKLPGPDIPFVPKLNVPEFAKGGVVNGPTLAMVGEGGESEYIIPASKMAAASANYLNGARGGAVIPSSAGGGGGGGSNAQINITTGPVTQIDNQRYATIEDLQSVARQTATQIYATLRTPAGRRAIGVA